MVGHITEEADDAERNHRDPQLTHLVAVNAIGSRESGCPLRQYDSLRR